ncbi:MAG: thiamine-binding protein [Acidimicrobiia bacterium]
MADYRAEFLIEPFTEGSLGPPVVAGIEAVRASGFEPEVGAFGTTIDGGAAAIADAMSALVSAALDAGATRVSIQVSSGPES